MVVVDSALPMVLPHPATRTQITATRKCGRWLAHVFLPIAAVPNRSAWRDVPHNAAREDQWCSNAAGAYVKLTVFLDNDERCFLITIDGSSTALSGSPGTGPVVGERAADCCGLRLPGTCIPR